MADWAPVLVGVVLFVLLSPGLLFQLPGHYRHVDFGGMKTNGKSIAVHTLIFVAIFAVLIMALHLHIYTGWTAPPLYVRVSLDLRLSSILSLIFFCPRLLILFLGFRFDVAGDVLLSNIRIADLFLWNVDFESSIAELGAWAGGEGYPLIRWGGRSEMWCWGIGLPDKTRWRDLSSQEKCSAVQCSELLQLNRFRQLILGCLFFFKMLWQIAWSFL